MNSEEVPLISCAAAAAIVEPVAERKWIFKTPQRDDDCARRIFEHAKAQGYTDIAIITGTTGFGSEGRKQLKKLAPEFGINIVADETYNPGDTEMTSQLTKIKNTSAKALVNWSIVPAQSTVPKNMKQLDMDIQLYQSHGFGNIKYVESAGEAAEGIIFPAGRLLAVDSVPDSNVQKKVLTEYSAEYKEKFGETPSTFGGHAYDGVMIAAKALEAADPDLGDVKAARAALRDAIEKVRGYVGTAGVFNMSAEDHCGLAPEAFAILTVKDGKFTILED
jgi:branched-chain amino acid transport system substrate-binding protein